MAEGTLGGRTAVVTGAGGGLGRACALHLAACGARVFALSLEPAELKTLQAEADVAGHQLVTMATDVSDQVQVADACRRIRARGSGVDLLVNNAGIVVLKPIEEMSVAEWDRVVATNLRSAFLLCHELVATMKLGSKSLVVNVSSQSGIMGFALEAGYCPSKHGLEGLTKTLALESQGSELKAVSVTPGAFMRTAMSLITLGPEEQRRWHEPSELAPGFAILATQWDQLQSGERYDLWKLARSGQAQDGVADGRPLRQSSEVR